MGKAEKIKKFAQGLGFELVGVTAAHPSPDHDFFRWWLDQGYGATMAYLNRQSERRGDPEKVLPGVKSVICVGLNYFTGASGDTIARYAHGQDYHRVIDEKLKALETFILSSIDASAQMKRYVDTGPVLERSYAARAGLGWIGKNTMLINNGLGSFFFLAEILTTIAFDEPDYDRPALDQCGTCTKCLEACPTDALPEPGVLDATKCISYLTIEYRGEFTESQSRGVGTHLYGCDVCQDVCPYNDRIPATYLPEFQPRPEVLARTASQAWDMTEDEFQKFREGSAMDRIRYAQWQRNLSAVRKNKA